jgi:type IV secretory pathway VirB2 component (pilin)
MRFIKNNIWTLCLMALFGTFAFIGDASADTVMDTAKTKAINVFVAVKTILFIVGGFGLVGIAFAAIFGKLNWKWFAALAVGLAIVAAAGSIVNYATGDTNMTGTAFSDSFTTSTGS